jgi:ABC-type uncharacterized transport system fused permease/ATPase subunit
MCAFLPQQPYLPLGDTLRDQLLFPQSSGGVDSDRVQSSVLVDALASVGLSHVLERCVTTDHMQHLIVPTRANYLRPILAFANYHSRIVPAWRSFA